MTNPLQPIIIVKKKSGHGGHHGGAWKVAYADFVTAMMAFFMVMWIIGQSEPVKAGIGGYFRDPVAFEASGGRGVLPGGDTINPPKPETAIDATSKERQRLEAAVLHIREGLDKDAFKTLRDQVEFTVTPEGLRIDLIEKDESTFFDSGSATLRGETGHILGVIAHELGTLDHKLDLEGHTDGRSYASTVGYSNWELSADRANAARRVMEHAGLKQNQVTSVRGLADRQLRYPAEPLNARNRRVSILVKSPLLTTPGSPPPTESASIPNAEGATHAEAKTSAHSEANAPAHAEPGAQAHAENPPVK
jgi:chemotaxis protein MotB